MVLLCRSRLDEVFVRNVHVDTTVACTYIALTTSHGPDFDMKHFLPMNIDYII
jgi:hypothetical protein